MDEHAPPAADPPAGDAKTSDVYHVNDNLPERFNNPAKFRGYSRKFNPLYQTSNQAYGSKQPSVHDMPTTFFSRHNKFSEQQLKSGMYQNNSFNTALDKTRISEDNRDAFYDRVNFHCLYRAQAKPR